MDKKSNEQYKDDYNRLLHKEDFLHHSKQPASCFTDTETNIALIIILFVIIMLFLVPITDVIH